MPFPGPGSRSLPRPLVVATLVSACLVFGSAGVLYYRALERRHDGEDGSAEPRISVPLFVPPDRVEHSSRFAFSFDPPQALSGLRRAEGLDQVVAGATGDEARYRRLMAWTREQWELGRPDPYPPPDARRILSEIRAGRTGGFCAQYCFVLAQAIQSFGRPARYVSIHEHEVIEAWLADEQRWVMLDPTWRLQVLDAQGRSLSALEIHNAAHAGPTGVTARSGNLLEEDLESYLDRYQRFAVWLRNDLVTRPLNFVDFWHYRAWWDAGASAEPLPGDALRTTDPRDLYPALPSQDAVPATSAPAGPNRDGP